MFIHTTSKYNLLEIKTARLQSKRHGWWSRNCRCWTERRGVHSGMCPHCTPTNCKYYNDKYKLGCAECKRLVHYGCTSLPTYQLQLFLTKGYRKFICCKCVEIPLYLHAVSLNRNGELREQVERFIEVVHPDYDVFTEIEGSMKKHMEQLGENVMKNLLNDLQDSEKETEENLTMWWSKQKVTLNQCKIPHKRKIKLPMGHTFTFCHQGRNQECRISWRKWEATLFQKPHYPWCRRIFCWQQGWCY